MSRLLGTYSLSFIDGLNKLIVMILQHLVAKLLKEDAMRLGDDATPSVETVAQYKV
jgi:hypothetical protein